MFIMKYNIYILTAVIIGFAVTGCKKTGADTGITVNAAVPAVSTISATNISGTNATVGGNITSDGGSIVMESGIVYGTAPNVDTSKKRIKNYTISGNFSVPLSGLSLLTTYYYRVYAINSKGIT